MTQEEKAKAYDKAIERAVNIRTGKCETTFIFTEGLFDYLFPELEECNEEEVREAMIDFFKHEREEGVVVSHYGVNIERMIAWLEKQGEPADINPSEFDLRLNKLLKQFETLPKEELASSLSFYLNVVQNDGTYRESKPCEQKPAWNEEDENEVAILEAYIRSGEWSESHIDRALGIVDELVNKCKSSKDRVQPQNQWKPSEKQMEALKEACDEHWEPDGLNPLYTLYQELKKLREE